MIEILLESSGNVLAVKASETLTHADYTERLLPRLEEVLTDYGTVRLLFEMVDFHGWQLRAMWDDLKLDVRHGRRIERCAVVGARRWEKYMVRLARPFFGAEIRYFEVAELADAWTFVREGALEE